MFSYHNTTTGGGVDFRSRQGVAIFTPGNNRATALIRLVCDRVVESDEEFDLSLSITSSTSGVVVGNQSMATGIITDSTSTYDIKLILHIAINITSCLVGIGFASGSTRVNENVGTASIPVVASRVSMQRITIRAVSSTGGTATGVVSIIHI